MVYRAIGLHCGSYNYGFDIAQVQFHENAGKWDFEIVQADHISYTSEWQQKLEHITTASSLDYLLADNELGAFLGNAVSEFINKYQLQFRVQLIAVNGYSTFNLPQQKLAAKLGNGAVVSASTGIPVVSDFNSIDLALGGHGGPVIAAQQLLFNAYDYYLQSAETVTLTVNKGNVYNGFEICAGIQLLQHLLGYKDGAAVKELIERGSINEDLNRQLNNFSVSTSTIIDSEKLTAFKNLIAGQIDKVPLEDVYRTYWQYLTKQIEDAITLWRQGAIDPTQAKLLLAGDANFDSNIADMLVQALAVENVSVEIAAAPFSQFSQAVQWALCGLLRWRDEYNHQAVVTGASRNSIGGALWMGAEA